MKIAKIILKDEVNCKIQNLELSTRQTLSNQFKYFIPNARYTTKYKLKRWNGKITFFQLGGTTYINLLDEILPTLLDEGYEIELQDNRKTFPPFEFDQIKEDSFSHITWPPGHTHEGEPIILHDHQVKIANLFLSNLQSMVESATGSGKTIVTGILSLSIEKYGRSIIIVPNKSLVTQTEEDYVNMGLNVGVYYGDRKEFCKTHTICTWQSLNNLFKNPSSNVTIDEFLDNVICVIVDECHTVNGEVLKAMLSGPFANVPIRWGLTGTVPKEEFIFRSLQCTLGNVVGQVSAAELQQKKILANCHVNIMQLSDDVEFKTYQSELKYLLTDNNRLDIIAESIKEISGTGNTVVLVDRKIAGTELVKRLGEKNAVFLYGGVKVKDRKKHYDEIATENDKIIVATYGILAIGINLPRIFNLVLIEPGKSFVRVIQSIGRGIRVAKDKDFVQIWDITSTCKFAKRHLRNRKHYYKEANYPFTINKIKA